MGKINYLSKIDDGKKFEKNTQTNALNILYTKEKEILPALVSNHNSAHKKNNSINDSNWRK